MLRTVKLLVAILLLGCTTPRPDPLPVLPEGVEAISLRGDTLLAPTLPADVRAEYEAKLAEAEADYRANRRDADAIIWLGRRTAYLGNYREAVRIYSEGVERYPDDARLYRHRGHRFITLRMLDEAIADLRRAAELTRGQQDQIEPDGLPNARNIPTSTLQSNIWYHLGLAHYLKREFEPAVEAYRECLEWSTNPDMLVATSHWLYMTLRRLGRRAEAAGVLEPITAGMDIIENDSYHRLLLMYKGLLPLDSLTGADEDALQSATVGYGIANWHLYNGRPGEALQGLEQVLSGTQWAAFGYIAAEAEIARAERGGRR